jgi:hypothetical protein
MHVLYQAAEVTWSVPRPGEGRTDKQRIGGTSGREFSQALMFQQASAGGGSRTARKTNESERASSFSAKSLRILLSQYETACRPPET